MTDPMRRAREIEAILAADPIASGRFTQATVDALVRLVGEEMDLCARIAERTYAKDAFHFELGTAIAAAIRGRAAGGGA